MRPSTTTRRALLGSLAALGGAAILPRLGAAAVPSMHVVKDPNCGCCSAWIDILERDGFKITTEPSTGTALSRYKLENGIPADMASCHTGRIDGYMIEGHVPPSDIRRLLNTRPDAVGLETARDAYDVHLIRTGGETEVFARYSAA